MTDPRELADLRAFAAEMSGLANDLGDVPNTYPDDLHALAENLHRKCADLRAENERLTVCPRCAAIAARIPAEPRETKT